MLRKYEIESMTFPICGYEMPERKAKIVRKLLGF